MHIGSSDGNGTASAIVHTNSKRPLDSDTMVYNAAVFYSFLQRTDAPERRRKLILSTIPSLLNGVVASGKEKIRELASVSDAVMAGGAPLDYANGEELVQNGVNLLIAYGM